MFICGFIYIEDVKHLHCMKFLYNKNNRTRSKQGSRIRLCRPNYLAAENIVTSTPE